jgi:thymidine phosphorylase
MLLLGGKAKDEADARKQMEAAINNGAALKVFREMCTAQGGDPKVVDDYKILPAAKKLLAIKAPADAQGFVSEVDALKCGHAIMALGGGRAAGTHNVDDPRHPALHAAPQRRCPRRQGRGVHPRGHQVHAHGTAA